MSKFLPSPEQIARVLASIPEGFIPEGEYGRLFQASNNRGSQILRQAVGANVIGRVGMYLFDNTRLNSAAVRQMAKWCRPALPPLDERGHALTPPVVERRAIREMVFGSDQPALAMLQRLSEAGLLTETAIAPDEESQAVLARLLRSGAISQKEYYIYDPLRLSLGTIEAVLYREALVPAHAELLALLAAAPGGVLPREQVIARFPGMSYDLLKLEGAVAFTLPDDDRYFVRLESGDLDVALKAARAIVRAADKERRGALDVNWEAMLAEIGDRLRPDTEDGTTPGTKVAARTYTIPKAAARLGVSEEALLRASRAGLIRLHNDPTGKRRISAEQIETAYEDAELGEAIASQETVTVRAIATVCGVSYNTARARLKRAGASTTDPAWQTVRGQWGLPDRHRVFQEMLRERKVAFKEERRRAYEAEMERQRQHEAEERRRREELRQQLLAIFPTWEMVDRTRQRVTMHVGPTNSGKTHEALNALAEAGSGWYLAPLRLLAYEIFERLNARGVLCNLLTGEEYIPIPGARITSATIEMFNPMQSGECVVIDEAHMFADPDRGAAWTRALLEAQAPDIRVLGAPVALPLVEKLSRAVSLPVSIHEHTRLTPIRVADEPWSLKTLPPRTILVAFSRKMVLGLKLQLERMGRTVSVVYGNLPPEVRRRQSERFASESCEICVATDAVGMGLNLPADNVCFYELDKFDGYEVRDLQPHEVQQIGGRAGRFGLSNEGIIGTLQWDKLRKLRKLYYADAPPLWRAHVAPSVEAISIIPGTLAHRLHEWSHLQSIPEALRGALQTANMAERIELAAMLEEDEVQKLGYAAALKLINAPTRVETRDYWRRCATAILNNGSLPLPSYPPREINSHHDLTLTESCIQQADIYLWLGGRQEFRLCADREEEVRAARMEWSLSVDAALLSKIDTTLRCVQCGNKLPPEHRYSLCDSCFQANNARQHRRGARRWR